MEIAAGLAGYWLLPLGGDRADRHERGRMSAGDAGAMGDRRQPALPRGSVAEAVHAAPAAGDK